MSSQFSPGPVHSDKPSRAEPGCVWSGRVPSRRSALSSAASRRPCQAWSSFVGPSHVGQVESHLVRPAQPGQVTSVESSWVFSNLVLFRRVSSVKLSRVESRLVMSGQSTPVASSLVSPGHTTSVQSRRGEASSVRSGRVGSALSRPVWSYQVESSHTTHSRRRYENPL